MESKNSNSAFLILMMSVVILLIGLIVAGFVAYSLKDDDVIEEDENGADIILNYTSNDSGLSIKSTSRVKDADGMLNLKEGEYFDFSVEVLLDNASSVEYEISVEPNEFDSTISNDDIRIYLEKEKEGTYTKVFGPLKFTPLKKDSKLGSKRGSMPLIEVKKTNSNTDNYRLRMWLSDKSNLNEGTYSVEVEVHGMAK